jgi:hypothetical protein
MSIRLTAENYRQIQLGLRFDRNDCQHGSSLTAQFQYWSQALALWRRQRHNEETTKSRETGIHPLAALVLHLLIHASMNSAVQAENISTKYVSFCGESWSAAVGRIGQSGAIIPVAGITILAVFVTTSTGTSVGAAQYGNIVTDCGRMRRGNCPESNETES